MIFKYNYNHRPIKYFMRNCKKDLLYHTLKGFYKKHIIEIFEDYRILFKSPAQAYRYLGLNDEVFFSSDHSLRISSYSLI